MLLLLLEAHLTQKRILSKASTDPLRWVKDQLHAANVEQHLRPLWHKVTGKRVSRSDQEMIEIMRRVLRHKSVYIDLGAHRGFFLDEALKLAPGGHLLAFEPIPHLAAILRKKYKGQPQVEIHEVALSDEEGEATFLIHSKALGYSHLEMGGNTAHSSEDVVPVTVRLRRLDDCQCGEPDLVKIDVEGAELQALRGAEALLAKAKPVVLFEHGQSGAERFGTEPEAVFDLFERNAYAVSLMDDYLNGKAALTRLAFRHEFDRKENYNFIAHPR